jgi:hypothetical protein
MLLKSKKKNSSLSKLKITLLRVCLAQLQLLILSEDLEEPCQTGIF